MSFIDDSKLERLILEKNDGQPAFISRCFHILVGRIIMDFLLKPDNHGFLVKNYGINGKLSDVILLDLNNP